MNKYAAIFIQLRMLADQEGDERSLVALAAQFEREAELWSSKLARSLRSKSHIRNRDAA